MSRRCTINQFFSGGVFRFEFSFENNATIVNVRIFNSVVFKAYFSNLSGFLLSIFHIS